MDKKKKLIINLTLILIGGFLLYSAITYIISNDKINTESDIEGKHMTKEDYVFKEDLIKLGYTMEEIKLIETKVSEYDTKQYLLNKKYPNITKFINSTSFNAKNIERYESYYENNDNLSFEKVVMYVEIGLDKEFYTNIKEVSDYDNINTLVNKYNKLPDNFEASDLVSLNKDYSPNERKMKKEAAEAMVKMIDAAKKDNINLFVVSGYRTEKQQETLFNNSNEKNGLEHALLYSAKKGHSEHQTGYAADLNSVDESFKDTNEYKWLNQNAFKYGFIERYKKDKEFITGYGYEPWHYRYVGIDIATKIYTENITFEEYCVKYK